MEILYGPDHPANDPRLERMFDKLINLNENKNQCFICRAESLIDPKYTVRDGIFFIIPWYLCYKHIPKTPKFLEYINRIQDCRKQRRLKYVGLDKKRYAKFEKFKKTIESKNKLIPKFKDSLLDTLLDPKSYSEDSEQIIKRANTYSINKLNQENEGKTFVGTLSDFERYAKERISVIRSDYIKDEKKSHYKLTNIKRAAGYFSLALAMINFGIKWSNGENPSSFPETSIVHLEGLSFPDLKKPGITPCETVCTWVGGTEYPCWDKKCLSLIRQAGKISLLEYEGKYYITAPISEIKDIHLSGKPIGEGKWEVNNGNIRPLRDFFKAPPLYYSCPENVLEFRLWFILNSLFWKTVSPLLQKLKNILTKITLTMDNVWLDYENNEFYIWDIKKSNGKIFEDRFGQYNKEELINFIASYWG